MGIGVPSTYPVVHTGAVVRATATVFSSEARLAFTGSTITLSSTQTCEGVTQCFITVQCCTPSSNQSTVLN